MFDQPSRETMVIGLLGRFLLFKVLTQLDQPTRLFNRKALVQEGIYEQIHVLLHAITSSWITKNYTTTQRYWFDNCVVWSVHHDR